MTSLLGLVLAWSLTATYAPEYRTSAMLVPRTIHSVMLEDRSGGFSVDLAGEVRAWDHLRAYGGVETLMSRKPGNLAAYQPWQSNYRVGAEVYSGGLALGVFHECDHPVISDSQVYGVFGHVETRLYIRISGEYRP